MQYYRIMLCEVLSVFCFARCHCDQDLIFSEMIFSTGLQELSFCMKHECGTFPREGLSSPKVSAVGTQNGTVKASWIINQSFLLSHPTLGNYQK